MVEADKTGTVTACDALKIGRAAFVLGAGREHANQDVHPGVGLTLHKKIGEPVERGEPLVTLRVGNKGVEAAMSLVRDAYGISESA